MQGFAWSTVFALDGFAVPGVEADGSLADLTLQHKEWIKSFNQCCVRIRIRVKLSDPEPNPRKFRFVSTKHIFDCFLQQNQLFFPAFGIRTNPLVPG